VNAAAVLRLLHDQTARSCSRIVGSLISRRTQREIGEALYARSNTVKAHVKSIFRKLDVATRPDAVSRARKLRLL
jgi:LuxR family transcriptional regulator, maltose regulon positive regulatory protein